MKASDFKKWLDAHADLNGSEKYRTVEAAYKKLQAAASAKPSASSVDPQKFLDWMNAHQDAKGTPEYLTVEQAYIKAANAAKAATPSFSVSEMVKNIPHSAAQMFGDIKQSVTHPVESAKNLGELLLGIGEKLVPGKQPEEVYADAAKKFISSRYGSWDRFLHTLQTDPVGTLTDLSAVLTGGGALLARAPGRLATIGRAVERAGMMSDPLVSAANAAKTPFMAAKALNVPRRVYEGAAKFTKAALKEARKGKEPLIATKHRLAEHALNEGVLPSYKGIYKLQDALDGLDIQLEKLIEQHQGKLVPTNTVFKHLKKYADSLAHSPLAPQELSTFGEVVKNAMQYLSNKYGDKIPVEELQKFKVGSYKRIDWSAIRGEETAKNAALKAMAKGAQEAVAKAVPGIDAINKRYGILRELQNALQDPANRIANRALFGARTMAGGMIGGATGGTLPSAAIGAALSGALSPEVAARIALALHRAGRPWVPSSEMTALLRQAAYQTGNLPALGMLQPGGAQ